MPKLRIHELAKELNKTNKEVMDFLKGNQVDVKSHMSTLEPDQESMVRKAFAPKAAQPEKSEARAEKPKKKSNIIQVVRPQNARSQEAREKLQQRVQGKRQRPEAKGPRQSAEVRAQSSDSPIQAKAPQGEKAQAERNSAVSGERAQAERTFRPAGDRNGANRPSGDRSNMERGGRPSGDRNNGERGGRSFGDRNNGERGSRPFGDRNNGERGGRSFGDRNNGERGARPFGDRNNGERGGRSFGDRNNGERGSRPFGDRNNGERGSRPFGDRNGAGRPQGDRRSFGDRNNGERGGRPAGDRPARPQAGGFGRDRKPQVESIDLGLKKPSRDTSHKDKDKTKDSLREKKYGEDRRPSQGNRPNQGGRKNKNIPKALQKPAPKPREEKKEEIKEIRLPEKMTIRELADAMKMQPSVIVKKLFMEGIMVTVNHEIDFEKAQEIALGYDIIAEPEEKVDVIEELLREEEEDEKDMVPRPPVVCVMGHVDHGKTSLLDAIRNTHVTDREAGGITQHIGATVVTINGQKITFLDTPGHEAFTAMRMRGANSTDIAVLVVAADDGVMPQTVEAINHAKAAGVEIIVAINKIDKPSANVERVKQELSEYELIPEDWGGSTVFVPVSAHTQEGITELLEMILLTAEVMELKANPKRRARGLVIEAQLDKGKGPVANILIQKGTLHVGDYIAAGACSGKVRAMMDDKGRRVKEAGPSTPVELLGLNGVPNAGEIIVATETDKDAKNFAATFVSEGKNKLLEETKSKMSLDDLFSQIQEGNLKELNIVVKADVQGSVEAVKQSLVKLSNEEVVVKIVHGGVGAINESDVTLAAASNAIIIGFNVRPDTQAKAIADQEGVDVRLYRVIYQAIEDVEAAMKGMLDPVYEEKVIGHAEVRQLFKASGIGTIAGSYVLDGTFQRGCKVRISREGTQIFEGALASLKRFKDDVKEVKAGYECGLVFEGFNDLQELDQVEAYIMVEVPR